MITTNFDYSVFNENESVINAVKEVKHQQLKNRKDAVKLGEKLALLKSLISDYELQQICTAEFIFHSETANRYIQAYESTK